MKLSLLGIMLLLWPNGSYTNYEDYMIVPGMLIFEIKDKTLGRQVRAGVIAGKLHRSVLVLEPSFTDLRLVPLERFLSKSTKTEIYRINNTKMDNVLSLIGSSVALIGWSKFKSIFKRFGFSIGFCEIDPFKGGKVLDTFVYMYMRRAGFRFEEPIPNDIYKPEKLLDTITANEQASLIAFSNHYETELHWEILNGDS